MQETINEHRELISEMVNLCIKSIGPKYLVKYDIWVCL